MLQFTTASNSVLSDTKAWGLWFRPGGLVSIYSHALLQVRDLWIRFGCHLSQPQPILFRTSQTQTQNGSVYDRTLVQVRDLWIRLGRHLSQPQPILFRTSQTQNGIAYTSTLVQVRDLWLRPGRPEAPLIATAHLVQDVTDTDPKWQRLWARPGTAQGPSVETWLTKGTSHSLSPWTQS